MDWIDELLARARRWSSETGGAARMQFNRSVSGHDATFRLHFTDRPSEYLDAEGMDRFLQEGGF